VPCAGWGAQDRDTALPAGSARSAPQGTRSSGLRPPEMQLHITGQASKAARRSCSEKIQLQELVYREEKDLCLNAHAVFCALARSDGGGLDALSEQRCGSAVLPGVCGC